MTNLTGADYDDYISKMLNVQSRQAFLHVNEFCNPSLIPFDEVMKIISSGKIEEEFIMIISSIKIARDHANQHKSCYVKSCDRKELDLFDDKIVKFGLDLDTQIITKFGQKSIIKKKRHSFFMEIYSNEIELNSKSKPYIIYIFIIKNICPLEVHKHFTIYASRRENKRRKKMLISVYNRKTLDCIKFYRLGC
jgi:hypothetical protein